MCDMLHKIYEFMQICEIMCLIVIFLKIVRQIVN